MNRFPIWRRTTLTIHVSHLLVMTFLGLMMAAATADETASPAYHSPFLIRSWQTAQGLPNNTVHDIAETRDGYLWVGTDEGLVRFDGVDSKVFGLKEGLQSLHINALLVDHLGALWIGTIGGGLSRLSGDKMETFTQRDGLPIDSISALWETAKGELWVGTFMGLSRWQNGRFEPVDKKLGASMVYGLAEDRSGTIWVSTLRNGLLCYANGIFSTNAGPSAAAAGIKLRPNRIFVDAQDRLWVGSRDKYLMCYDHGQWRRYDTNQGLPSIVMSCLGQGPDGTIWAGSLSRGLYYLQAGQFKAVKKSDGLPDESTIALFTGSSPFLWVGTQTGGLVRIGPKKLSVYHVMENNNPAAAECLLRTLAQTTNGEIYVGTFLNKLYRQTGETFEQVLNTPPMNAYLYVEAMLSGRDGSLWWGAGPTVFQWQAGKMLTSCIAPPWLENDRVWALCEDIHDGIWVGTYNGNYGRFRQGQFKALGNFSGKPVTSIVQATDGTLWIGSFGGGMARYQNGEFILFTTKDGLGCDLVRTLYLDAEGVLWIGTDGGGLSRYAAGRLTTFTREQGLMDDSVLQILEDDNGYLWMGCNRGICRVRKAKLTAVANGSDDFIHATLFGTAEGMTAAECMANFGAAMKTQSGQLYFATQKGIVVIDPRQQTNTFKLPKIILEDVLVEDRMLKKSEWRAAETCAASQSKPVTEELEIPPGHNHLEFHYTGFNFDEAEGIQFRYRLVGLDSDWSKPSRKRQAFYHYIPSGHYRFQVMACNSDGIWNSAWAEVTFKILPHFWQTVLFKVTTIALIIGSLGLVIFYWDRRRHWLELKRVDQERNLERLRIAHDLHDELGARLTGIAYLGELAIHHPASPDQLKQKLSDITSRIRQIMSTMSEVVWTINPKNDSLPNIVSFLIGSAEKFLDVTQVNLRLEADPEFPPTIVSAQFRHNLLLAVKEALNNAVRHGGATLIQLRIHVKNGGLEVVISDNGHGFDPLKSRAGGNGLANIRSRMELAQGRAEITSQTGQGTTVTLFLPLPNRTPAK